MLPRPRPNLFSLLVLALLSIGTLAIIVQSALNVLAFRDSGYPDSAMILRISDFVHHGQIYPDSIVHPPYYATIYGPLTYVILALPYRVAEAAGIDVAVALRLAELAAFCACVFLVFLISRRVSTTTAAALSAVFALSSLEFAVWTTVIRGDFIALAFSLWAIYATLQKQSFRAAVFAALAFLVKQTFIAAPLAVVIWLLYKRRFKESLLWAALFASTVALVYGFLWLREPLMTQHFAALRHPVLEYPGAFQIIKTALSQPMLPFALVGAVLLIRRRTSESSLLLLYCLATWLISCLTIPQVGGTINYFWEPLLLSAILAGPALTQLQQKIPALPVLAKLLIYALVLLWFFPLVHEDLAFLKQRYNEVTTFASRKAAYRSFTAIIKGQRVLSNYPDLTVLSRVPQVPDPVLNRVLEAGGHWSYEPITAQLNQATFDIVVVSSNYTSGWRGIHAWNDQVIHALKSNYTFSCEIQGMRIWLPRDQQRATRLPQLEAIGCQPPQTASIPRDAIF